MTLIVAYALLVSPDYQAALQIASLKQTQSDLQVELRSLANLRAEIRGRVEAVRKRFDRIRPAAGRRERQMCDLVSGSMRRAEDNLRESFDRAVSSLREAGKAVEAVQTPLSTNQLQLQLVIARLRLMDAQSDLHRGVLNSRLAAEFILEAQARLNEAEKQLRERSQPL